MLSLPLVVQNISTLQAQEGHAPTPATSEGSPIADPALVPTPATLEGSPAPTTLEGSPAPALATSEGSPRADFAPSPSVQPYDPLHTLLCQLLLQTPKTKRYNVKQSFYC